jgi:hypothetical protein
VGSFGVFRARFAGNVPFGARNICERHRGGGLFANISYHEKSYEFERCFAVSVGGCV